MTSFGGDGIDYLVSVGVESIDKSSESILSELTALLQLFHPSEKDYDAKVQKVKSLIEMVTLKFQSVKLFYEEELRRYMSQLANRDVHISLLEDAFHEMNRSYRTVVERNDRISTIFDVDSTICSSFSSLSGDSDEGEASFHIKKISSHRRHPKHQTADKATQQFEEPLLGDNLCGAITSPTGNCVKTKDRVSHIPRLNQVQVPKHNSYIESTSEVRRRVHSLNLKIAEVRLRSGLTQPQRNGVISSIDEWKCRNHVNHRGNDTTQL